MGKDHCTAGLQLTRLDLTKNENMLLLVCSEAVESILVKLETSCTVIIAHNGECSLHCLNYDIQPHTMTHSLHGQNQFCLQGIVSVIKKQISDILYFIRNCYEFAKKLSLLKRPILFA